MGESILLKSVSILCGNGAIVYMLLDILRQSLLLLKSGDKSQRKCVVLFKEGQKDDMSFVAQLTVNRQSVVGIVY